MEPPQIDKRTLDYKRTHNLLLASRLLNQKDHPSPFTLVLDSINQSSAPLVQEYISRAVGSKIKVLFVSFETSRKPAGVDVLIAARRQSPVKLREEILKTIQGARSKERWLVVIDSLHPILHAFRANAGPPTQMNMSTFLGSLLSPTTTLLATFHTDVPIAPATLPQATYTPDPVVLLGYLATTLITVHSSAQTLECKSAMDRSQAPPKFGVAEGREGALVGIVNSSTRLGGSGRNSAARLGTDGIVFELEHRRKSGRGMVEWFYLSTSHLAAPAPFKHLSKENIVLLEDHPGYSPSRIELDETGYGIDADDVLETTFSLGLTDKQKEARDQVVLPYFDAQKEGGGTGGRILYTPGREDDWDEEEDEI